MDNIEFDREPPGDMTTMVMAFGGWIDAGRAATGALRHLVRDLPASRSLLEAWGIYHPPTYEGPTGISSVVLDGAERRGMQHVGFMGQAPHYLQDAENPAAIETLVSYVARLLNLSPDMSQFPEAIQDFRTQCDKAVARDRATREHVRQLEQEFDAAAGEEQPPLPGGELDSRKLIEDLEDFLRKQREGGAEG